MVIPSKCANEMVLVRCQVEEVDVLGAFVVEVVGYTTTVEVLAVVVVHVFVEGLDESESLGVDGSRSRFEEEVEVLAISATVVVHGGSGT